MNHINYYNLLLQILSLVSGVFSILVFIILISFLLLFYFIRAPIEYCAISIFIVASFIFVYRYCFYCYILNFYRNIILFEVIFLFFLDL